MKKGLIPLMLGGLAIGMTEFIMMGILPQVAGYFNVSIPEAGHLISIYALGVIIGAPLLILFSSKYSPKKLLIVIGIMLALFNGLSIFAMNYEFLMVTRFLSGLPHGAFFGVGSVVAMRIADPGKESQAIALMFAGLTVANLLGIPLTTSLVLMVGWQIAFVIVALIGVITVVTVLLFIPNLELEKVEQSTNSSNIHILLKSNSWLALGVVSLGFAGVFAWYSYISPLIINITQLSNTTIPYILFLSGLGMFFGNLYGGKLTDRVGAMNATIVTLVGLILALLLMYLTAKYIVFAIVMSFGLGFFAFALVPAVQTLVIEVFKEYEMLGSALSIAGFNIANAIGAFAGGLPIAYGFSYSSSIVAGMIISILGVLILFMLKYRLSGSIQNT
ncbi:MFS transporter [Francisella tularensis subsp. novicida]|uniref:MFS transporter n=1 Tax=Francisella tularensis TaxID=263 RepID=UPI000158AC75|nr:MFS transporter [Francisella tularensis]AJI45320.1 sugar (and other) transporter family protein [Francisella tularensis subsp. novicida F6168]AJJ48038.1 sugar (and other) transporter family protein [Francisella tularensis subsp. novicida]APC98272.1 sugar (and other) transporter family protein [Francisella tularensis subsp. novicida]EDN35930.1 MFS family major facilitator transporter [Francisella tularensis subsp. novicida GA99-3549]KFJ67412.1 sugar (and other) transporter family protein [Fr